jgi:putative glutathione S-transferase
MIDTGYVSAIYTCIFRDINNGVYRSGFATTQEAYDKAVREVFAALDRVEEILSRQRYLTGSTLTEADVRLYTTLVRFDCVYVGHFKVGSTNDSSKPSQFFNVTKL